MSTRRLLIPCLLLLASAALLVPPAHAQEKRLTARQVIERIKAHVGVPWREQTIDTFKAGDPDTPVTGVAVTMMATLDVLQRAAAQHANLIITHEPTFFGHRDQTEELEKESDAVLAAKQELIKKHGLVIFRFHDHWHLRRPDGIQTGMTRALGWEKYQNPAEEHLYKLPATSLSALASRLKKTLGIRAVRVVGDPNLRVTGVAMAPGAGGFPGNRRWLQREDVDALVVGETTEWETIEYVADAVTAGKRKAVIVLGHIPSEQAGMEECARWLKGFVTEAPIQFVPSVEPFWTPK